MKKPAEEAAEVGSGTETREAGFYRGHAGSVRMVMMDMKEVPAMTEASGLTDEQGSLERASAERSRTEAADGRAIRPTSEDAAVRWAERLRKATLEAPLQSLLVAFLLGIWFARRR